MAKLRPQAAAGGYAPDCYVTSDLVPNARPSPAMIFKNMIELDVWSPQSVVKVDDTTGGIKAGLYGGMWTVGIAKTVSLLCTSEGAWRSQRPLGRPAFLVISSRGSQKGCLIFG